MRRIHAPAVLVTIVVAGALLAACGSDSGGAIATAPSSTTSTSAASEATTTTTTAGLTGGSTAPVSTPIQGHTQLTGVRAGDQGGFDRITFDFRNGVPGYSVSYIQRPVQEDASGKTVEVQGDNVLSIHLAGASGVDLSGGKVTKTYTGPTRFSPTTPSLKELVETGDFEGVLTWAVGTKGKPAFKVTVDPAAGRVIVDVAHP